jgi:hypothetical protein
MSDSLDPRSRCSSEATLRAASGVAPALASLRERWLARRSVPESSEVVVPRPTFPVAPKIVYRTDRQVPVVNGRLSTEHAVHTRTPDGDPLPPASLRHLSQGSNGALGLSNPSGRALVACRTPLPVSPGSRCAERGSRHARKGRAARSTGARSQPVPLPHPRHGGSDALTARIHATEERHPRDPRSCFRVLGAARRSPWDRSRQTYEDGARGRLDVSAARCARAAVVSVASPSTRTVTW